MKKLEAANLKLGIVAGGQLGKMLIQEASKWDIATYVLDADENCPAGSIATQYFKGSHHDFNSVYNFGKQVDVLTYEIESINIDALFKLKEEGLTIVPDPITLQLIQDKGLQKEFYCNHGIPTAPFQLFNNREEIIEAISSGKLSFPFVQKLRKGGYDGRGVLIVNSTSDTDKLFDEPSVIEQKISIATEIAVIAARNQQGEVKSFPTVEMIFDSRANLVDKLICPAGIGQQLCNMAESIAINLIDKLGMAGLLAVEFFVDTNGNLIVNEVAPRPHNSGHHTIESIITSQFEQHLRAVLNLPLGSTKLKLPAVMVNLIGEPNHSGPVSYEGLTECMAIEGVKVHLYGKKQTRPFRKMGHSTIIASTMEEAFAKAEFVQRTLKVKSWKESM